MNITFRPIPLLKSFIDASVAAMRAAKSALFPMCLYVRILSRREI
jgi:hypothetical protein